MWTIVMICNWKWRSPRQTLVLLAYEVCTTIKQALSASLHCKNDAFPCNCCYFALCSSLTCFRWRCSSCATMDAIIRVESILTKNRDNHDCHDLIMLCSIATHTLLEPLRECVLQHAKLPSKLEGTFSCFGKCKGISVRVCFCPFLSLLEMCAT